MIAVSSASTTNETDSVSAICCSNRRRAVAAPTVPVTGSCVLASESVKQTIGAERRVLMEAMATIVPVTYSLSMLIVGTHSLGVTTTNLKRMSELNEVTLKAYFPSTPRETATMT
jgi:hypothetical protein